MQGKQSAKGIFITTSSFNENAKEYARSISLKLILIDGERLAGLMFEHDVGVNKGHALVLKTLDTDYFLESE